MSNLIKSEWYRITHSRPSLPIIILGMLGCALISFLGGEMLDFKRNSVSQTGVMSIYLCAIVLSSLVDTSYTNRIAFYEIMDGKSPNQIIMSKLVVYTPLALICCYSTVSALLLIFDGGAETRGSAHWPAPAVATTPARQAAPRPAPPTSDRRLRLTPNPRRHRLDPLASLAPAG